MSQRANGSMSRSTLLVVLTALLAPVSAHAEDTRPVDMPYEVVGAVPTLDPGYRRADHAVVRIANHAIRPRLTVLDPGQQIAWVSHSRYPATIVFERETARAMVCHSLVNFSLVDDELRSAAIRTGEFASFCELQPGRYRYRVVHDRSDTGSTANASEQLQGVIVVPSPSDTVAKGGN